MRRLSFALAGSLLAQEQGFEWSERKERALGSGLAADTRLHSKAVGIPAVSEYVDFIGHRLTEAAGLRDYRFDVIVSETDEPFGFPGGFIFVPASFFLSAQSESEFAAMIAHTIGHVALRHGTRSARIADRQQRSTIPLVFFGHSQGIHAGARRNTALVPNGFRDLQRHSELAADEYAAPLLVKAGFDAYALRRYVERVHPGDGLEERLSRIDAVLNGVHPDSARPDSSFSAMRDLVQSAFPAKGRKPPSLRR